MQLLTAAQHDKMLDTIEQAYADDNHGNFSLSALSVFAGLDATILTLAFRSRQALIDAVLLRVLTPVSAKRTSALALTRDRLGPRLLPAHVMGCLVLPLVHLGTQNNDRPLLAVLERASADTDTAVRNTFRINYASESQLFDEAFQRALPSETSDRVARNASIFTNDFPGPLSPYSKTRCRCAVFFMDNG
jgi:AcrR family transcriptional regulator